MSTEVLDRLAAATDAARPDQTPEVASIRDG
jgi:hypothetical protein